VVVIVLHYHKCVDFPGGEAVLVIRTVNLVRYVASTRSGNRIPWDDWKGDVMGVEIPYYGISYIRTFVHGTRVLLITYDWPNGYRAQAYDFSRRGCMALVRVGARGKEKMVMPNPENVWSPGIPDTGLEDLQTLGDSLVTWTVSDSHSPLKRVVDLRFVQEYGFPWQHTRLGADLVVSHRVHAFWV